MCHKCKSIELQWDFDPEHMNIIVIILLQIRQMLAINSFLNAISRVCFPGSSHLLIGWWFVATL